MIMLLVTKVGSRKRKVRYIDTPFGMYLQIECVSNSIGFFDSIDRTYDTRFMIRCYDTRDFYSYY